MFQKIVSRVVLLMSVLLVAGACGDDPDPMVMPHADRIMLSSGAGHCGQYDARTMVRSATSVSSPARISGGNTECVCQSNNTGEIPSLPVTTLSYADTWGEFLYEFELPSSARAISLKLEVVADDGAQIFLNEHQIGQANFNAAPEILWEENQDRFVPGTNVLRFYLVNRPEAGGLFGEPMDRFGPGDCMSLEFSGVVDYVR